MNYLVFLTKNTAQSAWQNFAILAGHCPGNYRDQYGATVLQLLSNLILSLAEIM